MKLCEGNHILGPTGEFKRDTREGASMSGEEELYNHMGKSGKGNSYAGSRDVCRKDLFWKVIKKHNNLYISFKIGSLALCDAYKKS